MNTKQRQHKMLDEIFASKDFERNVTFFKDEFKQIAKDFVDVFDLTDESILMLKSLYVKPFGFFDKQQGQFYGFYNYYPLKFDGQFVGNSKISLNPTGFLEDDDEEQIFDLSLLEKNLLDEEIKNDDLLHVDICQALTHEMSHFFSRKEMEILDENQNELTQKDIGTEKAKNGNVLLFNGGVAHGLMHLDESGNLVLFDDANFSLQQIVDEEMQEQDFEENSITQDTFQDDYLENQFNEQTVLIDRLDDTVFGKYATNFHEGMTEFFAQKLIKNSTAKALKKLREDEKLFNNLKTYNTEASYVAMMHALNGQALEKVHFQGQKFWNIPVLQQEFVDDFRLIFESFEKVQEILNENEMICDELDFLDEIEETTKLSKEELQQQQKFEQQLKENNEKIVSGFEEFCVETKSILKRQQKNVKKALDDGQINLNQLKDYFVARNGLVSAKSWFEEFLFNEDVEFEKIEELTNKHFKEFEVSFQDNKNESNEIVKNVKIKQKLKQAHQNALKLKNVLEQRKL